MKIIRWPYAVPSKTLTGHASFWLTDFPYYDLWKKNRKLVAFSEAVFWIVSVSYLPLPTDLTPPHTIMDLRKSNQRNILTHARVNFSQSETSLLLRGGGS